MIHIKTEAEIELMRQAGKILAGSRKAAEHLMVPGGNADDVNRTVEEYIRDHGGSPAFKNQDNGRGAKFPAAVCFSIDEEVVHGIPAGRIMREGMIIGVDIGVVYKGYYADSAWTYGIGEISPEGRRLMDVTLRCLELAMAEAKAGARLSNIGHAVQSYAESFGFGVVRELVGHGVGKSLWEDPQVPNYGTPGRGPMLRRNMTIAIEPMITMGTHEVDMLGDWDVLTKDRKPAAHFEHTMVITDGEPEILTQL
ncbi:type I methionyl aminopeptidase [bacterium]|nr:type I methionyl aminopeptidase [bacterium]MBU1637875.1 type I methionyl aminopeptidase [bacterium]MBU1920829.1 type I methionyl aminopeptidase [bacterium]